jgi:putative ABC transport system permease protein
LFTDLGQQVLSNVKDKMQTPQNSLSFNINNSQRINNYEESKSFSITLAYLAVYLGIVFFVISAVVLAITQLSEASDNTARYALLQKLGADSSMINKALFSQIAVYFGVPLLLAVIHSIVGISAASNVILLVGERNVLSDSILTAVVVVVIYGGYFLATYFGSKRIIGSK